jgi:hypothetical protein
MTSTSFGVQSVKATSSGTPTSWSTKGRRSCVGVADQRVLFTNLKKSAAPATTTRRLRVRLPPATASANDMAHERKLSPKCPVRQILSEIRCLAPWVQGGRGLIYCGA